MSENALGKFKSLEITQLDEDNEHDVAHMNGEDDVLIDGDDEEEEEEDEDEEEQEQVTLGFLEKPKNRSSLLRHFFPSKAGGVPAWLDPMNLPCGQSRQCGICGEPLQFVLQVYAPLSEQKESAFHRTLYVLMCPSMACLLQDQHEQWKRQPGMALRSVKVFRCQLARINPFYSDKPPKHDGTDKPATVGAALCNWCCTWKGDKVCGSCRRACYCSEKHQALHWKSGHKNECRLSVAGHSLNSSSTNFSAEMGKVASNTIWPEYDIVQDYESEFDKSIDDMHDSSMVSVRRMDEPVNSLMDTFEGDSDKKSWASFQERITRDPEQVLRYCRNERGRPLWPMSSGRPSRADIPKCSYCGGHRQFEFQVLPQLLYYFHVKNDINSLDWSTIVVYTCESSCEEGVESYKEEFAWVQLACLPPTIA